jgi:hypothetical protein
VVFFEEQPGELSAISSVMFYYAVKTSLLMVIASRVINSSVLT